MSETNEKKKTAAKKEKAEIIVPELSGAALVLKENLPIEVAMARLEQFKNCGLKYDLKEYKRTKDYKIQIKGAKGLEKSGFNVTDPSNDDPANSFRTMEDCAYGALAHLGYTLEHEKRYKEALEDGTNVYREVTVYSTKPEESLFNEVGTPIDKEKYPGMNFVAMTNYKRPAQNEKVAVKGFSDYIEDALKISEKAKKDYLEEQRKEAEEKAKLEAEEKAKEKPAKGKRRTMK